MYEIQRADLAAYYQKMTLSDGRLADEACNQAFWSMREAVCQEMEALYREEPETPSVLLKSRLHTLMAKHFEPIIFAENPFFFEMGMRESTSWGLGDLCPGHWLREKLEPHIHREHPICAEIEQQMEAFFDLSQLGLCQASNSFDGDHHTLGYTTLFAIGINGLIQQAQNRREAFLPGSPQYQFCQAAEESCRAMIAIAEKFAQKAKKMLQEEPCASRRRHLERIAETAGRIPANPPQTFYEGLCMLLFTREASATLENIGVSQLGHVDRLLGGLYEADLQAGRITEEEARELIGIWMLHTDIKFDLAHASWPETSTCIQLGGCDADGNPVYNAVTRMFIEEHHRLGLVNPKLNCRYCADSPDEYLKVAGRAILAGHNNFVLINDEIIISGLIKSGVEEKDARCYVSGGCQETMIEGFGHTEGVAFYASVPRVLDLFLRPHPQSAFLPALSPADSFEAFYEQFLAALNAFFRVMTDQRTIRQQFHKEWTVAPFFSATQRGCIENGMDYSHGGAKYNFSTVSLIGYGTVADSLYAIKSLVYDQKKLSLEEMIQVLANNWEGCEALRQEAISLPKYGHNHAQADAFADRFLRDLTDMIRVRKNERGGSYIPSLFVYYHFETFSRCLRATPDGRRDFDLISAGSAPSQLKMIKDVTVPVKSMQHIDFTACGGGSSVLDVKLPVSKQVTPDIFAAFIRACAKYRCPTLQPNVVSQEELLDAKLHPDKHQNLIVRICGLSAYFVALTPQVQDEIIQRNLYAM
ncbi:MAG: hypothetical protein E7319_00475 [Clostridiales bacterium]|nr:hypothetical protein [Clostridiales bacterium]